MEPNDVVDSCGEPVSVPAPNRTSPPIIVGSASEAPAIHVPRKATGSRPPLATASQSSSMSLKVDQNKSTNRRLEKQSEVEDGDAFVQNDQQFNATSPTGTTSVFPEPPRSVASLDVPGRAASFDSSSLASNGSISQTSIEKQSSLERPVRLGYSENSSPAISRDSSTECNPYTDYTGADLEAFIKGHLNKSAKDREVLMSIEQRLSDFVKQGKTQCYSFPQMSSYHRMFVHRVSAYFGLDHNVDQTGKAVIVSLTPNTRLPDFKFRDLCSELPITSGGNVSADAKKSILKRDSSDDTSRQVNIALENTLGCTGFHGGTPASSGAGSPRAASVDGSLFTGSDVPMFPSRSFEEREADYQKARRRIFNDHEQQSQHSPNCLGSPLSHPQYQSAVPSWGSADSPHVGQGTISGPYIAKANSFGGTSGQPQPLPQSAQRAVPVNVNQGSSQQNVATSPSTLVVHQQMQRPQTNSGLLSVPKGAVYVLAPSVDYVAPGSVVINPQTGEAFQKRTDGSLQSVIIATPMNTSPTSAGSPVQSSPGSQQQLPPNNVQFHVQSTPLPQAGAQPQGVQRFVFTAPMPGSGDSQQYTIVGQPQQTPSDAGTNMHEVMSQLSIVSPSDLPQYAMQQPSVSGSQYISPQPGQSIILASVSQSPLNYSPQQQTPPPQNNGSYNKPSVPSYQISNGQYIYQVPPGTSLLSGPPNQSPQTSEVGSPQLSTNTDGSAHQPQQLAQPPPAQCWILANPPSSAGNSADPSVPTRQVILVPSYGPAYPPQHQTSQHSQTPQQTPAVGQVQGQSIRNPLYGVYSDQQGQQAQQQPSSHQHQSQAQAVRAFAAANPPPPVPPRQVPARNQSQQQYLALQNTLNE